MADEEDLKLLRQGHSDLTRCDFREAELSGMDLAGRDFTDSHLERVKAKGANFSGCNLQNAGLSFMDAEGANFSGAKIGGHHIGHANFRVANFVGADLRRAHLNKNDFSGAKLIGANFSAATILPDNCFDDAIVDETTRFDEASTFRAVARGDAFRYYEYKKGKLLRKGGNGIANNSPSDLDGAELKQRQVDTPSAHARVRTIISVNPTGAEALVGALSAAIEEEIRGLEASMPNDPDRLTQHQDYCGFLRELSVHFHELRQALSEANRATESSKRESQIDEAAETVLTTRELIAAWLRRNKTRLVDSGFRLGTLGIGCAFLTFCGAPPLPAFLATTAVLEGDKLVDSIRKSVR